MASKIEERIDNIIEYINSCKYVRFSNVEKKINVETMDELLRQLQNAVPDEVRRYQKIISNKEAIMADAERKANELIDGAHQYINNSVNESEIMQQAYAQAGEIIQDATNKAQDILDQATLDADGIRTMAMQYTDDKLAGIEDMISAAIETTNARHESLVINMRKYLQQVVADRAELHPEQEDLAIAERAEANRLAERVDREDNPDLDIVIGGSEDE